MTERDFSYYRRRAEDERRAAERAKAPNVSRIHRELAQRYSAIAEAGAQEAGKLLQIKR